MSAQLKGAVETLDALADLLAPGLREGGDSGAQDLLVDGVQRIMSLYRCAATGTGPSAGEVDRVLNRWINNLSRSRGPKIDAALSEQLSQDALEDAEMAEGDEREWRIVGEA